MSQIYKSVASTPSVPIQFDADTGSAVPAGNILNLLTDETSDNNNNGIHSEGSGNTVTHYLTNRLTGTATTVGAVTEDIVTFDLGAVAGAYKFHIELIGFESGTPSAGGYSIEASIRTTGAAATIVGIPDGDEDEDAAFVDVDWDVIASGNNIVVQVIGDTGLTINWRVLATYTFVS